MAARSAEVLGLGFSDLVGHFPGFGAGKGQNSFYKQGFRAQSGCANRLVLSRSFSSCLRFCLSFSRPFSKILTFYHLLSRGAGVLRERRGSGHAQSITPARRVSGKFGDEFCSALILLGRGRRGCGRKSGRHPAWPMLRLRKSRDDGKRNTADQFL